MNCDAAGKTDKAAGKKILLITILSLLFLLLILCAAAAKLVFAPWQEIPPTQLQLTDFMVQNRLIGRISREFSRKNKLRSEATLKLTVPEVNSLLRLLGNIQSDKMQYPLRYYRPQVNDNGIFSVTYPLRTSARWLWGGTIYIMASAKISKTPEQLMCDLELLKLTSISLPLQQAQQKIDSGLLKLKSEKNYKRFDQAIKSIAFDGKRFIIVYRPQQMMQMLMQR